MSSQAIINCINKIPFNSHTRIKAMSTSDFIEGVEKTMKQTGADTWAAFQSSDSIEVKMYAEAKYGRYKDRDNIFVSMFYHGTSTLIELHKISYKSLDKLLKAYTDEDDGIHRMEMLEAFAQIEWSREYS